MSDDDRFSSAVRAACLNAVDFTTVSSIESSSRDRDREPEDFFAAVF